MGASSESTTSTCTRSSHRPRKTPGLRPQGPVGALSSSPSTDFSTVSSTRQSGFGYDLTEEQEIRSLSSSTNQPPGLLISCKGLWDSGFKAKGHLSRERCPFI